MADSEFVHVIYIAAPQQRVWDALIQPEFTRQYWEHVNVSEWKAGATWEHREANDSNKLKLTGTVVEFTPPSRLVLTWGDAPGAANPSPPSRVTLELDTIDTMVRVRVTHDQLVPGSNMLKGISNGWPRVLSSLKTLLETGKPLPTWVKAKATA